MESLIFSKPILTKLHVLKSSFLPTLTLPHLNIAAARGRSASCLRSSSASQTTTWKFVDANTHHHSSQPADGWVSKPHFFTQLIQIISNRPKVITVTPSAIVLLSAFCLLFIHPLSAFATSFQTAAKSGGGGLLVQSEILNGAWTGFLAGCLHTLSGPDHLAALAPLSIGRTRMESAAVGALWGCGHDAGQLLFGLLFLLLKDRLSLHIGLLETWGTRVVGFTLLVIGAMGIREAYENENGEFDVSLQGGFETAAAAIGKKSKVGFATFATGIVHGLQPDALMMVVPALALPSRFAGAAFLFMFLAGTVIAMGGYTAFLASCSQALKDRVPRITEKLTWASSLVAIALGWGMNEGRPHKICMKRGVCKAETRRWNTEHCSFCKPSFSDLAPPRGFLDQGRTVLDHLHHHDRCTTLRPPPMCSLSPVPTSCSETPPLLPSPSPPAPTTASHSPASSPSFQAQPSCSAPPSSLPPGISVKIGFLLRSFSGSNPVVRSSVLEHQISTFRSVSQHKAIQIQFLFLKLGSKIEGKIRHDFRPKASSPAAPAAANAAALSDDRNTGFSEHHHSD
nr:uncharacterized protein LOC114260299 [Ipomoea batatas]